MMTPVSTIRTSHVRLANAAQVSRCSPQGRAQWLYRLGILLTMRVEENLLHQRHLILAENPAMSTVMLGVVDLSRGGQLSQRPFFCSSFRLPYSWATKVSELAFLRHQWSRYQHNEAKRGGLDECRRSIGDIQSGVLFMIKRLDNPSKSSHITADQPEKRPALVRRRWHTHPFMKSTTSSAWATWDGRANDLLEGVDRGELTAVGSTSPHKSRSTSKRASRFSAVARYDRQRRDRRTAHPTRSTNTSLGIAALEAGLHIMVERRSPPTSRCRATHRQGHAHQR